VPSGGDIEMGPSLLEAVSKGVRFPGGSPQKSLASRQADLFAPSEAGYTTDGTEFDFSDTDGSDVDLDSPTSGEGSGEIAVEESAVSIGELSLLCVLGSLSPPPPPLRPPCWGLWLGIGTARLALEIAASISERADFVVLPPY